MAVMLSTSITAEENHINSNCYSTDSEIGDSAAWAAKAIELFSQNKFSESVEVVDLCFDIFSSEAVLMQRELSAKKIKYPPIGRVTRHEKDKIHNNWAVNDVAMALWAKAVSLEEIGKNELAKKAYSQCIFLVHGRAWDPKGWFWNPAGDCLNRAKKLLK